MGKRRQGQQITFPTLVVWWCVWYYYYLLEEDFLSPPFFPPSQLESVVSYFSLRDSWRGLNYCLHLPSLSLPFASLLFFFFFFIIVNSANNCKRVFRLRQVEYPGEIVKEGKDERRRNKKKGRAVASGWIRPSHLAGQKRAAIRRFLIRRVPSFAHRLQLPLFPKPSKSRSSCSSSSDY